MAKSSQPDTLTPRKLEEVVANQQGVLSPEDTVQKAGDKMRALNTEMLPVSEGRRLVGIVDEKDPDRRAAGFGLRIVGMIKRQELDEAACRSDGKA